MKILLASIGTRGDMEPFLAIGALLKDKGHEVICLFPEQFKNLVDDSGMKFSSLGSEFIEMLESKTGRYALGGGGTKWKKAIAYIRLAKIQSKNNKLLLQRQKQIIEEEKPDRIVHNGKIMYPVLWEIENWGKTIFVSPVPYLHYVKGHSHLAFSSNYGAFLNKLTYALADWGLLKTIMSCRAGLKKSDISKKQIKKVLESHKIIYTISPQLFKKPDYWKDNLKILGYHERYKAANWRPGIGLINFLEKHPKSMFITFGSMTNPNPEEKTKIILNILERNNIPAIINTAGGGLIEPDNYDNDLVLFVSEIPYDWVFPKVYAVIHHGGSGTTHTALKNGCVSMIIPHIIDQFIWNNIIFETGAGPKGIKISKINEENLEPKILELINNPEFAANVQKLAKKMQKEDFTNELCDAIVE